MVRFMTMLSGGASRGRVSGARRGLAVALGLLGPAVLAPLGCLGPTEVTLVLSTDACDLDDVAVFVGKGKVTEKRYASDPACVTQGRRELGTLGIVPSGQGPRFTVTVAGKSPGGDCGESDAAGRKNCIVASRTVSFQPHTPLTLPIALERACFDVDCPDGETCLGGKCVREEVDCTTNETCVTDAGLLEAGPLDTGLEAGLLEAGACVSGLSALKSAAVTHHWSFDEPTGDAVDGVTSKPASLPPGYLRFPKASAGCGSALVLGSSGPMALNVVGLPRLALLVRTSITNLTPLVSGGTNQFGWTLAAALDPNSQNGRVQLVLSVRKGPTTTFTSTGTMPNDLSWHAVELVADGSAVRFAIDGTADSLAQNGATISQDMSLWVGPVGLSNAADIDELWTYGP